MSGFTPNIADKDVRVVVGLDFGTTFSGFAYAHTTNPNNVETNDTWHNRKALVKTNTALLYDEKWNVTQWGAAALASKPKSKNGKDASKNNGKPVELFKIHLGTIDESQKPPLPLGLDYKRAITDYLRCMGTVIKDTLNQRWRGLSFHRNVLKVMTVPAEFDDRAIFILRTCAYEAGFIEYLNSELLEFTTEQSFLIVDCGGGTVDLTMRTIKADGKLTEATERTGEFCGGSYVDQEFLKYVGKKVGASAVEMLRENHYGQLQYLIQGFCSQIKYDFNDNPKDYKCQEMDLEELCPAIKQYVKGSERLQIEEDEWIIELDYETVKSFFDPVVTKICALIRKQLSATRKKCSAMFVVGGFSTSQYLFKKIKKEFDSRVSAIASPPHPIAAVMYGAVFYGINKSVVETRVLKRTYGLELTETWSFKHPIERKRDSGGVYYFHTMAQRGTEVPVDKSFLQDVVPFKPSQTSLRLSVYTTSQDDVTYCDDPGTELLGTLVIDLPDPYTEREVEFTLTFGAHETKVKARNKVNGRIYTASYKLVL